MDIRPIKTAQMRGTLTIPTSKSITHRALILAALSGKACTVRNPLHSDDTTLTLRALKAMGYEAHYRTNAASPEIPSEIPSQIHFTGTFNAPTEPVRIDIHHSGTSARLLTAIAAIQPISEGSWIEIDGSERMRQRPMLELITPLQELGAEITHSNGLLPLRITKPITHGGCVRVNAHKSSQFLSALLLIAPCLQGETTLVIAGEIASQSYSDMTLAQMRGSGVQMSALRTESGWEYVIAGGQQYKPFDRAVEGDYSAASYPIVGAMLTGGSITIPNVVRDSVQGDRAIVDIAERAGAHIEWHGESGVTVRSTGTLHGITRDMNTCPDIVPTVAVMALFAEGTTRLENIEHLRFKESDRVQAVIENIERLGGRAYTEGSALVIEPHPAELHGAQLPTYDDHRMAMSFALAGLRVEGVMIENPACVAKSYPEFWRDWECITNWQ